MKIFVSCILLQHHAWTVIKSAIAVLTANIIAMSDAAAIEPHIIHCFPATLLPAFT